MVVFQVKNYPPVYQTFLYIKRLINLIYCNPDNYLESETSTSLRSDLDMAKFN